MKIRSFRRTYAFLVLFMLYLPGLQLMSQTKLPYGFVDERLAVADSLVNLNLANEALVEYEKQLPIFQRESSWENLVYIYYERATIYRAINEDSLAHQSFNKGIQLAKAQLPANHMLFALLYLAEGKRADIQANTYLSISYLDSAGYAYDKAATKDSLLNLEIMWQKHYSNFYGELMTHRDTSFKYLNLLKDEFQAAEAQDSKFWFFLLTEYSALNRKWGDYKSAANYAIEGISAFNNLSEPLDVVYLTRLRFELAASLYLSAQYEQGLKLSRQLLAEQEELYGKSSTALIDHFGLVSLNFEGAKQYDSALYYSNKAIAMIDAIDLTEIRESASTYRAYWTHHSNQGMIYENMGDPENAERVYLKALRGTKRDLANSPQAIIEKHRALASFYAQTARPFLALAHYDSTLTFSNQFSELTVEFIDDKETMFALGSKIMQAADAYLLRPDTALLHRALKETDMLIESIDFLRNEFQGVDNKLELSEQTKPFLEASLYAGYELYAITGDPDYVETALMNMSRSKAIQLMAELGEYELVARGEVSDEDRLEYSLASKTLARLDQELAAMLERDVFNDSLSALNAERLVWNNRFSKVKARIVGEETRTDSEFLGRWSLSKYREDFKLRNEKAYIEYFAGENHIYIASLTGTHSSMHRLERTDDIDKHVSQFLSLLQDPKAYPDSVTNKPKYFSDISHRLYQVLMEPVMSQLSQWPGSLVLVPDDELGKIPFELIVTARPNDDAGFKELDYLLKDSNISYQFAAKVNESDSKPQKGTILGIAYADDDIVDERRVLGGLPGAVDEINYLKANFSGDYFVGDRGTKQRFLEEAQKHNILHLAIHGQSNTSQYQEPVLLFNGEHDFQLTPKDLFQTKINAQMAVLSACETGVGKLEKGEGILSMARGFATAGVPSIVTTLWTVNDNAGSKITQNFYQHLDDGLPKDEALRLAKLDYLYNSNAVSANPYYWGGYIHIGDTVPIQIRKSGSLEWLWICVLSLGLVLLYIVRKRRQVSS